MESHRVCAMAIVVISFTALALTLALTAHACEPESASSADCCPTVCNVSTELPEPPELTEEEAANFATCYLNCIYLVGALMFQHIA